MRIGNLSVWAVHLLTVSGAAIALMALLAAASHDWRAVFVLLGLALIVDGVDGPLARRLRVATRVPWFDGAVLDLVIDYTTYVIVPAMVVAQADLVPEGFRTGAGALIAIVGALYMADTRMKTPEAAFRGFPAVWNAVVFQLLVYQLPEAANLAVIVAFAVLTFVPVEFIHPVRVRELRPLTLAMTALWAVTAILAVAADLAPGPLVTAGFALASLYLALIGAALQFRRRRIRRAEAGGV